MRPRNRDQRLRCLSNRDRLFTQREPEPESAQSVNSRAETPTWQRRKRREGVRGVPAGQYCPLKGGGGVRVEQGRPTATSGPRGRCTVVARARAHEGRRGPRTAAAIAQDEGQGRPTAGGQADMALQVDAPFPPTPLAREDVIKLVVRGREGSRATRAGAVTAAGSRAAPAGGWAPRNQVLGGNGVGGSSVVRRFIHDCFTGAYVPTLGAASATATRGRAAGQQPAYDHRPPLRTLPRRRYRRGRFLDVAAGGDGAEAGHPAAGRVLGRRPRRGTARAERPQRAPVAIRLRDRCRRLG